MADTFFTDYKQRLNEAVKTVSNDSLETVANVFLEAYRKEQRFFIFGNGGSGATASHIAGDFLKGVSYGLTNRFRFICLNDNNASMMAIANDIGYEDIFIEPLKNFLQPGDVVIGLSGSGNSENVVKAMRYAAENEAICVAFCGYDGGKIKKLADYTIHADIRDMEISEDVHMISFHIIKNYIISLLKGDDKSMGEKYDKRV